MGSRGGTPAPVAQRGRRWIFVLKRAEHDLLALSTGDREAAVRAIDALAGEPTPRGSVALHGRADGHLQRRVGRLRLLYRLRGPAVILVAVTSGPM